jgi:DNA-binding LacI/PurR family transcriptional regulator
MQLIDCPLTVVAQPIEELAETAANLIIRRIQKPDQLNVQSIVLEPRLITRGTAQTSV